jgi:hypothetical protein
MLLKACNLTCLALTLATASAAIAQPVANPGERPVNSFVMKATHNSYERDEPMWQQIERYGTFCVELDMYWDNDAHGTNQPDIMIEHFCNSSHDARTLREELQEIATPTAGMTERVIFVYLEMKTTNQGVCYDDWPVDGQQIVDKIIGELRATLGLGTVEAPGTVYTPHTFINVHGSRWPSMQEINRLGHRFVVFVDDNGTFADNDLVFTVAGSVIGFDPNTTLLNRSNGNDETGNNNSPIAVAPRWLNRAWPNVDLCSLTNGDYWNNSVNRGFNFVATNCVDDSQTITDSRIHSPSPLYLTTSAPNSAGWGTWNDPMTSFIAATNRASAAVNISTEAGNYDVPNNFRLTRPLKITARGGTVRIR